MEYVSEVRDFLSQLKLNVLTSSRQKDLINVWEQWYEGKVKDFHEYSVYNGVKQVKREKKSLGLPKLTAEDWADLLLNEKVTITIDDENKQKILNDVLSENDFQLYANQLIETTFAFGTGAFVEYRDEKRKSKCNIDYVNADMIFPLRVENRAIVDVAFASDIGDGKYYVNIHTQQPDGKYKIENTIFNSKEGEYTIEALPDGVKDELTSEIACFQIITPNSVNNADIYSPMGMSVYGNALDQAKVCDNIYDSYDNEFNLGKTRVFVDSSVLNVNVIGSDGNTTTTPVFDTDDVTFYALSGLNEGKKIEANQPQLRVSEHSQALQDALNLYSDKVGLGKNHFIFKDGQVYTNTTQIISSNSKQFRRMKKHELLLESKLKDLVRSILYIATGSLYDGEISIDFDDSIIEDKVAERQQYQQEVGMKVMSPIEYRMKVHNEDEKTAEKMIPKADDPEVME